ncbi:MAG: hypothetical protein WC901_01905 [Candidatus Margulisiibacteriota bacterium]
MTSIAFSKKEFAALGVDIDSMDITKISLRDPSKHVGAKFVTKTDIFGKIHYELIYLPEFDEAAGGRNFLASPDKSADFDLQFVAYDDSAGEWVPRENTGSIQLTVKKTNRYARSVDRINRKIEKFTAKKSRQPHAAAAPDGLTGWGRFLNALHLRRKPKTAPAAKTESVEFKKIEQTYTFQLPARGLIPNWQQFARWEITHADGTPLNDAEKNAISLPQLLDDTGQPVQFSRGLRNIKFRVYYNPLNLHDQVVIPFDGQGPAYYTLKFFDSAADTSLRKTWDITVKKSGKLKRMERRAQREAERAESQTRAKDLSKPPESTIPYFSYDQLFPENYEDAPNITYGTKVMLPYVLPTEVRVTPAGRVIFDPTRFKIEKLFYRVPKTRYDSLLKILEVYFDTRDINLAELRRLCPYTGDRFDLTIASYQGQGGDAQPIGISKSIAILGVPDAATVYPDSDKNAGALTPDQPIILNASTEILLAPNSPFVVGRLRFNQNEHFQLFLTAADPANPVHLIVGGEGVQYEYLPAAAGAGNPAVRMSGKNFVLAINNPSVLGVNSREAFDRLKVRGFSLGVDRVIGKDDVLTVFVAPQALEKLQFTFEYTPMENGRLLDGQKFTASDSLQIIP